LPLLWQSSHRLALKMWPDYEPLFSILDGLRHDADRRFWIESFVTPKDNCDVEEDTGQVSTGVEIVLQMSHNTLMREKVYILRSMLLKSEVAQRELSDLGRGACLYANHASRKPSVN
jgi:hypothetical protein